MKTVLSLLLLFLTTTICLAKPSQIDSLKQLLTTDLSPAERSAVYQSIITSLWLNHPDSARLFAQEAINLAKREKDIRSQAVAVRLMGGVYLYKGDYDSALLFSRQALALSLEVKDSTLIASAINNIGFTHYHFGSYPEALESLLRSLHIKEKIHNDYGLGHTLNNIGLIYSKLSDYEKARNYFHQAIKVAERMKDGNIKLYSCNNIGFTYLKQQKTDDAEKYFLQSLEIAKTINNNNWHATAYSGLAQVKFRSKDVTEARKLFNTSLALRAEIGDRNGISEVYYFLSLINAQDNKMDSAFYYAKMSQKLAKEIKSRNRLLENYDLFKRLHKQRGQFDSALHFQERFALLNDSLFNENFARNLAEIQLSIQGEENKQVLEEKESQLQRRTILNNFLLIIILLVLILAITVFWFYRVQRKLSNNLVIKNNEVLNQTEEITQQSEALSLSNKELESAREKIFQQNLRLEEFNKDLQGTVAIRTQELEMANKELILASHELENFIYKSSHDMKGPLVRLLGLCYVALIDVKEKKAKEYFTMLNQTAQQLNEIFDRLKAVSTINTLEVKKDKIAFDQIVEKVRTRLKPLTGYEEIDFEITIDEDIEFYSDDFLIETIFYNMMENAVKFQKKSTGSHKFVKTEIKEQNRKVFISFTDNGIGIKKTDTGHIFEMFSKAALEHQNVGLGLYIVRQSLSKIKGSISLIKSNEKSTKFQIELPC